MKSLKTISILTFLFSVLFSTAQPSPPGMNDEEYKEAMASLQNVDSDILIYEVHFESGTSLESKTEYIFRKVLDKEVEICRETSGNKLIICSYEVVKGVKEYTKSISYTDNSQPTQVFVTSNPCNCN